MKQRVLTAIVFVAVMAFFLVPGYWCVNRTAPLLFLIGVLAAWELADAWKQRGLLIAKPVMIAASLSFLPSLLLFLFGRSIFDFQKGGTAGSNALSADSCAVLPLDSQVIHNSLLYFVLLLLGMLALVFLPLLQHGAERLEDGLIGAVSAFYLSFPLYCGSLLLFYAPHGWYWFVLAIVTPWIADTAAYFCGSAWGRRKLIPKLSPKKTWAGFIGGLAGPVIFYAALYWFLYPVLFSAGRSGAGMILAAACGAAVSVLTQLGDWFASAIKRQCGIKDFSDLLPGHGGILDRFDSTLFAFPAILTIALIIRFS